MDTITSYREYQDKILPGVSRTFALTIPRLPAPLSDVVSNAYLLCRIADTIEDDAALSTDATKIFHKRFVAVVSGHEPAAELSRDLAPELAEQTPDDERNLIENMDKIVALTHSYNERQRAAISKCLRIMCHGMSEFQERSKPSGLRDLAELDQYCYYVAGVVGEMLTELFCDYDPAIDKQREALMKLAPSFGQGLQMTNILKDVWADHSRGTCWLPQDIFKAAGCDLTRISSGGYEKEFTQGMNQLIPVAHAHLKNGLDYVLRIPPDQTGIRQFCLWALGMAVMSLRKIHQNPAFVALAPVKISHTTVKATIVMTNIATRRNSILRYLFRLSSRGLPTHTTLEAREHV